jgi:c-di-AMP phosphodiesterase-like protein
MSQKAKKKRQQRAQSRLALARQRQQQREQRQKTLAQRAEKQWNKALRQLAELGATVNEHQETVDGVEKTFYEVHFGGKVQRFKTRFRVQRWLKRERERQEEQNMSWAERHVQWMIDNNCDDHGNPWPWDELD